MTTKINTQQTNIKIEYLIGLSDSNAEIIKEVIKEQMQNSTNGQQIKLSKFTIQTKLNRFWLCGKQGYSIQLFGRLMYLCGIRAQRNLYKKYHTA